jgi:hypothetical protein
MTQPPPAAFLGWMPYFSVAYPTNSPQEVDFAKARLLPDTDDSWVSVTGSCRPKHLEIHRDFPDIRPGGLTDGGSIRGTLITSADTQWLSDHLDSVTAAVSMLATTPQQPLPSECFTTYPLGLRRRTENTDDDLTSYTTKHSRLVESSQSVYLTPPLAVRGLLRPRRLQTEEPWAKALASLLSNTPHDRLIVAARQYLRTQFSDFFTSPLEEDYALHCSAIEAALDILRRDTSAEGFANAVGAEYSTSPKTGQFFLGLYVARSRYIHGVSSGTATGLTDKERDGLALFERTARRSHLLRLVTREIIERALARQQRDGSLRRLTPAEVALRQCLESDDVWQRAKALLLAKGAAATLISLNDNDFAAVTRLASDMHGYLQWQDLSTAPETPVLLKCLKTCAIVIGSLTRSSGKDYVESNLLGTLADSGDAQGIEAWIHRDPWHDNWPRDDERLSVMQSIMRNLAKAFDTLGVVRD